MDVNIPAVADPGTQDAEDSAGSRERVRLYPGTDKIIDTIAAKRGLSAKDAVDEALKYYDALLDSRFHQEISEIQILLGRLKKTVAIAARANAALWVELVNLQQNHNAQIANEVRALSEKKP